MFTKKQSLEILINVIIQNLNQKLIIFGKTLNKYEFMLINQTLKKYEKNKNILNLFGKTNLTLSKKNN